MASLTNIASMTLDICGSFCANYTYFGVKNDGECYCGKSLGLGSTRADGCSMLCPGHIELNHGVSEDCGGSGRLSLFSTNGMPPIYPAVVASVGKYVHTGCYTERTTARALTGSQLVDSANMTVEVCEAFCAPTYSMFGVEYGSQVCSPLVHPFERLTKSLCGRFGANVIL